MRLEVGKSGSFAYVGCLRSFLSLDDLEFNGVALLQALVAVGGNSTVMNKNVRPAFTANEPVTFSIVEPLDGTFQTFFHLRPLGTPRTGGSRACHLV